MRRILFVILLLAAAGCANRQPPTPAASLPAPPLPWLSVRDFGAVGDGLADDTAAVQAAIDAAGRQGGTLWFPPGTYRVSMVGLRPGVHYLGYGATIQRPPRQGKWIRTFNAALEGYLYAGNEDSAPLTIEGLTFDGNLAEQGEHRGYELEQAHLLFLAADARRPGRLRARIVNCHFQNGVADGISLWTNVDVQILNCTARDCFRGGITITGGHSRIQVANFRAEGKTHPTGIDVEVDGAGYGGRFRIELTLSNVLLPDGDFDVGVSDGSVVLGHNIIARAPFHLVAADSTVRLSNCEFGVGRFSGYANRVVFPGDMTFQSCRFRVEDEPVAAAPTNAPAQWAALHVYWNISGSDQRGQSLKLVDCEFAVADGLPAEATTYAVYCEADARSHSNTLVMTGCRIPAEFTHGIFIHQGGDVQLRDLEIQARTPFHFGSAPQYPVTALLDGVRVTDTKRYAVIATRGPGNRFTHRHVELDESANTIETIYGLSGNEYRGGRLIHGERPPTPSTHGLEGDRYRLKRPVPGQPSEWICTRSGCGSGAAWSALPPPDPAPRQ